MSEPQQSSFTRIRTAGFDGFLVSFADRLSEPANRAALAFRDAVERSGIAGIEESSTSLVSAYLRFDPLSLAHAEMEAALERLLASRDWYDADLPEGRRLWRVPTVFGGEAAPQLDEAASAAGLTPEEAIASISESRVRVQTIGFAPGMPYLGELPPAWDIPRQTALTAKVPAGGLCVAIRQLVLFPVDTPTGWRHIGQTALRLFRPEAEDPFLLRPGDEVLFQPAEPETLANLAEDPQGGAVSEVLR
jgi:KipI family sensor histidine kinase inhibitor